MIARRLEALAAELAVLRTRARWNGALALAALAAAPLAAAWNGALAAGLVAGGLFEALLAARAISRRHDIVALLAPHVEAYELPEVRRYVAALGSRASRLQMAATLRELVAMPPPVPRLEALIRSHRAQLNELADDLEDPETEIAPLSAVALFSLVNEMGDSPLFNPLAPTGELHSALIRIHDGIRHGGGRRQHAA